MAQFNELSRREEKIVKVLLEMTFTVNGETITEEIEVAHFNPQNEVEIARGNTNRWITRNRELQSE
jgi:hypothetical protein